MTTANGREADHPISPLFIERWSPRAFTGETIPEGELLTILEAARWAPSAYNSQPWRFLYARRENAAWPQFLGLLNEFNQGWAQRASALVIVLSRKTFVPPGGSDEKASYSHSFDAGAAWASLALQAVQLGWSAHAMVGFDIPRTRQELAVPEAFHVDAAVAVGRKGDPATLPDMLRGREVPSPRMPLAELAKEGGFAAPLKF